MSFGQITPAKLSLAILAILFLLFVISYIYVTEVIIPGQIRGFIEEVSRDKGYKIEIKDIEFDFLSGLRGSEIEISDPVSVVKPILKIGEIAIKPEILSSLFNWRVKLRGIIIDKPVFSLTGEELNRLVNLFTQGEQKEKPLSVEVKHLEIHDARIEVLPDLFLNSKKMEVDFEDAERAEQRTFLLSGNLDIEGNEVEIKGRINPFLDKPAGELRIRLPELDTSSFLADIAPQSKLAISSDIRFEVSENITSHGLVNFTTWIEGSNLSGKLEYDLTYRKSTDTASFESINFYIDGLFRSSFAGSIEKVTKECNISLVGETGDIEIEEIPRLVTALSGLQFSGVAKADDIKLVGSKAGKNFFLDGDVLLGQVSVRDKNRGFEVRGINGEVYFNNTFQDSAEAGFSASGVFSFKNALTKIGEFREGEGKVEFTADSSFKNKRLEFSSLKGSFLDGVISGDARFEFLDGKNLVSGNLAASGMSLEKVPESFIPASLEGKLERVNAKFMSEDMKEFNTVLSFSIRDFRLETGGDSGDIKASMVESIEPIRVKLLSESPSNKPHGKVRTGREKENREKVSGNGNSRMHIEGKGISYENLSYDEFLITKGDMSELEFNLYENSNWRMKLSSNGSRFQITDRDVHINEFRLDIGAEKDAELVISGGLEGSDGGYGEASFPKLSTNFDFSNNLLRLTGLKSQLGSYGDLHVEEVNIVFGDDKESTPYEIKFREGSFSGFGGKVKSEGIEAELSIQTTENQKTKLNGNVRVGGADIASQPVEDLSFLIQSSSDEITLEVISGRFFGGDLRGNILVKTSSSAPFISSRLELKNPIFSFDGLKLGIGNLNASFDGSIENSSIPEGKGEIRFSNLSMERDGVFSNFNGEMQVEATGETISLKQGFIQNEEGDKIGFRAGVENIRNGTGHLWVDVSKIPLVFIQKTVSPLLPQFLSEGEFQGVVGLTLAYDRFLDENGSLQGEFSVDEVSFGGWVNGTAFYVKGINGAIPIKNEVNPFTSLPSLVRNYKKKGDQKLLDEKVFNAFLDTMKAATLKNDEGTLRIEEIVYGFLRFEDIECAIELTSKGINLKRLESRLYEGQAFGTGQFDFSGKDNKYDLSFLFRKVSLASISDSIPSARDYISGITNGLFWISGEGKKLNTLDGLFNFWTIKSEEEPRRIAKALLQKLGVKERFFLRESRKYDRGEMSGYIKDGVITFRELEISHRMFLIQDLSIKVDERRNSISVAHFLSVIRETAKRASKGELKIEYGK